VCHADSAAPTFAPSESPTTAPSPAPAVQSNSAGEAAAAAAAGGGVGGGLIFIGGLVFLYFMWNKKAAGTDVGGKQTELTDVVPAASSNANPLHADAAKDDKLNEL